ncbi:MAG: isoprenylcysteine carboxylmethyltransferase family protein [Lysobacterales bacterium]|nr:MAG: isoprenylcysteine carboxylmethyltransferase family protein [Xanthomonadales bacterium]
MSALELKIPPVAVTLLLAGLMWGMGHTPPGFDLPLAPRLTALAVFASAAATVGLSAVWSFRRARTTVNPLSPQGCTVLVTSGVFRFSRNPMYLALLLALVGWGLFLANGVAVLLALAFIPYMNRFQIAPEERTLQQAFGHAFDDYCRQVRRWL